MLVSTDLVNGNGTVYVVGTHGELHAFASSAELGRDGYDLVGRHRDQPGGAHRWVDGGGRGWVASALATSADRAIVDSEGAYYVFAGGPPFSRPNAALATIRTADAARALTGTVNRAQESVRSLTGGCSSP